MLRNASLLLFCHSRFGFVSGETFGSHSGYNRDLAAPAEHWLLCGEADADKIALHICMGRGLRTSVLPCGEIEQSLRFAATLETGGPAWDCVPFF